MTRISKTDSHPIGHGKYLVITNGLKISKAFLCILHRIKRNHLYLSRPLMFSILPLCLHFLNMSTVSEHDFTEIKRSLCADHLSSKSLFDKFGHETTVVNVGMSEQNEPTPWAKAQG